MFTFSYQQFCQLSSAAIPLDELLEIVNLQGLEVKKVIPQEEGDTAITIEVKANRAFCLSYLGLLREIEAYKKKSEPTLFPEKCSLLIDNAALSVPIKIEARSACPAFGAMIINHINNKKTLPKEMYDALSIAGINSVNPVVDLLNFIMLQTGQPLHAYDVSKIKQGVSVTLTRALKQVHTLNETEVTLPRGSLVIADGKEILAIAGVIGTPLASVTEETTSILIEAALFNASAIRITARALKISTPSAFRFERGVDASQIQCVLQMCLEKMTQYLEGKSVSQAYYFAKEDKPVRIMTSIKKINNLLGINLSADEILSCLKQYYFSAKSTPRGIDVQVPSYRLDIKTEIDLIGEVARIYGYHHIQPTLPSLPLSYQANPFREKITILRETLMGLGFDEVMNYSFIPRWSQDALQIEAGSQFDNQVMLQNPLSEDYALMRSSLAFSLMQTAAYNYSIGNKNVALFEIGKAYFRDAISDTAHVERDLLGLLFTGMHIERGFGLTKDMTYSFYDISNFLSLMLGRFGLSFSLVPIAIPFLLSSAAFSIEVEGQSIGYCGQINPVVWQKVPNGKLILTDTFLIELEFKKIPLLHKAIIPPSIFPAVTREYNFWTEKTIPVVKIVTSVKMGHSFVDSVQLKDIYEGKGVAPGKKALLIAVKYVHPDKTLTLEDVVNVEQQFLSKLAQEGIKLGQ